MGDGRGSGSGVSGGVGLIGVDVGVAVLEVGVAGGVRSAAVGKGGSSISECQMLGVAAGAVLLAKVDE